MKFKRSQRDKGPVDAPAGTSMPEAGPGTGNDCARCGRLIAASEESRRTAAGEWVHLAC